MNILQAIILSIVEGFTEFLPISSTGHLILTSKLLGISPTDFTKSFEIAIQLGAICSVIALYAGSLPVRRTFLKIFVSFVPTAAAGFVLYPLVKNVFLESSAITLAALFIGGIFIIFLESIYTNKSSKLDSIEKVSYTKAFFIGIAQSISIIPGVSRAAATIFGSMFLGLDRKAAVEYSFLLAVPTMAAATAFDIYKSASSFNQTNILILVIGFVVSFFVALISIKFLLGLIKKNNFVGFGVYRIILAIIFYLFLLK